MKFCEIRDVRPGVFCCSGTAKSNIITLLSREGTLMMEQQQRIEYGFGPYRVDTKKRQLLRGRKAIPVTAKAFDTLVLLLSGAGDVVSKDDLIRYVWPDTAVEENNLIQQISALRKVFGERAGDHQFIVTIPGRGYSFVAPVREISTNGVGESMASKRPSFFEPGTLTGSVIAFSFMFLIALGFLWSGTRNANRPQSLAILQFRVAAAGDRSIGTGISDTLRARLGSVEDLNVRPVDNNLVDQDALTAGRKLHVDTILTGSIQRENERVRVAVEMLDIAEGRIVWGKTFDDNASNIFALQDSIAGEIARVLQVKYTSGSQRAPSMGPARGLMNGHGRIQTALPDRRLLAVKLAAVRPQNFFTI